MYTSEPICNLLEHVSSTLVKQSDQVLQEQLGIGFAQFKILTALQVNPRLRQKDIAEQLGQTEASISRQMKLMLADGLLQLLINPNDHREHMTKVTPKGTRLTEAAIDALDKYQEPVLTVLGDKQSLQLRQLLEVLHSLVCRNDHRQPIAADGDNATKVI